MKMPYKLTKSKRRLSDDEFLKVWRALDAESFIAASAYRMLALTGTRKNEVLKMKWSEINWTKNIWTIPAERVKNNHDHRVPLVGMALEILRSIKSQNHAGEYVFYGPYKDQPLEDLWKVQARILKTTEIPHYTIHNLRRTVATGLGNLDVPNLTISLILNHTSESNDGAKITGDVYNHSDYDNPKRSALIKWDAHVRELTANTPKKLLGVDDTA